ncbi:MAG TPA: glycine zipper family protein [Anaerolineae bacterium]|nr:glycine zipper family protein [Anaerolineae bacterium]
MSKSNVNRKGNYLGLSMAMGLVIGGAIGLLLNNLVLFAGGGLVLGLAIGTALDRNRKSTDA